MKAYNIYFRNLNRQRKEYYSAETICRFVRDTLTDSQQFDVLKDEVYDGIIDTHEQDYDSGYKRLVDDLKQAAVINTSKCMLDSKIDGEVNFSEHPLAPCPFCDKEIYKAVFYNRTATITML